MTRIRRSRAFTLIEILVVVVILGILAAVVVPRFTSATDEAEVNSTLYELQKTRRVVEVYMAQNAGRPPTITTGYGTWGELITSGNYMKANPMNRYIPQTNQGRVYAAADAAPDTAYQTDFGWIFNTTTGDLWAGGFDAADTPLPRP
ncbi:MAG: type II secretion system protein [Phycisphaerales bacterium]